LQCSVPNFAVKANLMSQAGRQFDRSPFAPLEARRFVQSTMFKWGWRTALTDVQLVVAELINNAMLHTQTEQISLRLRLRGSRLRIEVTDGDPGNLATVLIDLGSDYGNGLRIVDAVATSWDARPTAPRRSCGPNSTSTSPSPSSWQRPGPAAMPEAAEPGTLMSDSSTGQVGGPDVAVARYKATRLHMLLLRNGAANRSKDWAGWFRSPYLPGDRASPFRLVIRENHRPCGG
jgi:anti-sigma regulatory factor (Ser/Thr protein kinase)